VAPLSGAQELLQAFARRGVHLTLDGDHIAVYPTDQLGEADRQVILAHRAELIALLSRPGSSSGTGAGPARGEEAFVPEVRWRVDAMRPHVPRTGPIPFLVVRSGGPRPPGHCLSCGDPLPEGRHYRCLPCATAVEQVLREVREDVREDLCEDGHDADCP
jgi:hypothetical protein